MGDEDPRLKRTLFGYSRDRVLRVLTAREAMFARVAQDAREAAEKAHAAEELAEAAEERAQAAEGSLHATEERAKTAEGSLRAAEEKARVSQQETHTAEERLHELEADLVAVRRELEERAEAPLHGADGEPAVGSLVAAGLPVPGSGLTAVLEATEKAVTQFIEEARHSGEEQLREAERQQQELQIKIAQLSEWWNRIEPFVADVQGSIDEAKNQANSVPGRIGSVLEPVTQAFGSLGNRLATLAQMAAIPLTGTPDADLEAEASPGNVIEVSEPEEDVVVDTDEKVDHPGRWW